MSLAEIAAGVLLASMALYVVSGGADFGSGIWQIGASGPRAEHQRRALREAIAPIWEANHVWLIVAVVILFVAFPAAFSAIATALHIPLALLLVGIVLRGSAFAFRSYPAGDDRLAERSERVFAAASVGAPFMLGVVAGAIASGHITVADDGLVVTNFVSEWLAPFPISVGVFVLALCAYLSAIYMTCEARDDAELAEDFRRRGLGAALVLGVSAAVTAVTAAVAAPDIWTRLFASGTWLVFHGLTGALALAALATLWTRRYELARAFAIGHAGLIVLLWGLAQYPALIVPDVTIAEAAAPASVLRPLLVALGLGALLLIPAFVYLFRVFKAR